MWLAALMSEYMPGACHTDEIGPEAWEVQHRVYYYCDTIEMRTYPD